MSSISIKLQIEGQEKTFTTGFVSGRMVREALVIAHGVGEKATPSPEELDTMVEFVAKVFGDKFTVDQFYDGLSSFELIPEIMRVIQGIMSK